MKRFLIFTCAALLAVCSTFAPYKNQSTDYLQHIEQNPADSGGKSFRSAAW